MYRLLFVSLFVGVFGQLEQNETCTTPTNLVTIEIAKMLNTWYEIELIPNSDQHGDCPTTTFAVNANNVGTISRKEFVNGTAKYRNGTVDITGAIGNKFAITYADNSTFDYYILAIDYTKFALVYTCKNTNDTANVWAWKLSRSTTLDANSTLAINQVLESYPALKAASWTKPKQTDCSGAVTIMTSPILAILVIYFVSKEVF